MLLFKQSINRRVSGILLIECDEWNKGWVLIKCKQTTPVVPLCRHGDDVTWPQMAMQMLISLSASPKSDSLNSQVRLRQTHRR